VEPAFTRSELERTFVELVRKAGLPTPSVNAVVAGYEVDILWRAERFGVELDTYEFHGTRAAFERDRRRHEDLKFQGIEIVRVTGQRIDRERELVVRRIGELLNRRRRETSGDG
jgi:very-short-patch-repair endonuclease